MGSDSWILKAPVADRPGRRQLHQKQRAENRRGGRSQDKETQGSYWGVQNWAPVSTSKTGKGSCPCKQHWAKKKEVLKLPILVFSTIRIQLKQVAHLRSSEQNSLIDYVWEAMWSTKI